MVPLGAKIISGLGCMTLGKQPGWKLEDTLEDDWSQHSRDLN